MNSLPPRQPAEGWRDQAACAGQDPRRFTDPRPETTDTDQALETCRSCPVRSPCLNEALTHPAVDDVGIWGATTAEQRALLRHQPAGITVAPKAPAPNGLFDTLDGDLTDLTGRALVTRLPAPPHQLLSIDNQPILRTDDLTEAWRHIVDTLDDYQPGALAPFVLSGKGELTDPTGRTLITRLPTAPHLLVVRDGRPASRHHRLVDASHAALAPSIARDRELLVRIGPSATIAGDMPQRARR